MCLFGCPEELPAPNQTLKNCRLILQCLAVGLAVLSLFSILAGQLFGVLMFCLLAYLLWVGWARLNWNIVMMFFLYSSLIYVQILVRWVKM